jgi:hypothetical protein
VKLIFSGRKASLPKIENMHKLPSLNLKSKFESKHISGTFKNGDFSFKKLNRKTPSDGEFLLK